MTQSAAACETVDDRDSLRSSSSSLSENLLEEEEEDA